MSISLIGLLSLMFWSAASLSFILSDIQVMKNITMIEKSEPARKASIKKLDDGRVATSSLISTAT